MASRAIAVGTTVGAFMFGGQITWKRYVDNHESALCVLLNEMWKPQAARNPNRVRAMNDYLSSSFWLVAWHRPPYGAYEIYKGKRSAQHSMERLQCLQDKNLKKRQ